LGGTVEGVIADGRESAELPMDKAARIALNNILEISKSIEERHE